MDALTPAERRGAIVVVLLLVLGAAHDLWRASRPSPVHPVASDGVLVPPVGVSGEPHRGTSVDGARPGAPVAAGAPLTSVDLNRATPMELDALPGVGPVLARRIIAHRERHGPFRHPEELLAVRGIGPRLFARLRSRVTVGPGPAAGPEPASRGR